MNTAQPNSDPLDNDPTAADAYNSLGSSASQTDETHPVNDFSSSNDSFEEESRMFFQSGIDSMNDLFFGGTGRPFHSSRVHRSKSRGIHKERRFGPSTNVNRNGDNNTGTESSH